MRNPTWTREEMILALDLYFRVDPLRVKPSHPEVILLSKLLSSSQFHPPSLRTSTFRNPIGIVMTLHTFMRYDVDLGMRGLRGGKLGRELWTEFSGRRSELRCIAQATFAAAEELATKAVDEEFEEGGVFFRLHRFYERNKRVVTRKKAEAIRQTGRLACEVCGFNFAEAYGPLGEGFIECHHRQPVHTLSGRRRILLSQLALVCSNCHRMLHRQYSSATIEQLAALVQKSP